MAGLDGKIGQPVTITGKAANASMGAIVFTADRTPVYLSGKEEWDSESGATVAVSGTLRRRSLAPSPVVEDDGTVSHGMAGDAWVIEGATWNLIS
jgi:hypothetical protein